MKLMKMTFVGLMIWLLTLVWPEVNLWLSPLATLGAIIGLSSLVIGYLLYQQRRRGLLVQKQALVPVRTTDTHPLTPISMA